MDMIAKRARKDDPDGHDGVDGMKVVQSDNSGKVAIVAPAMFVDGKPQFRDIWNLQATENASGSGALLPPLSSINALLQMQPQHFHQHNIPSQQHQGAPMGIRPTMAPAPQALQHPQMRLPPNGQQQTYQFAAVQMPSGYNVPLATTKPSPRIDTEQTDTAQKERRLLKNREAAKECRRKKKEYVHCLEERVRVLEAQNERLIQELKKARAGSSFIDYESQQLAAGEIHHDSVEDGFDSNGSEEDHQVKRDGK